MRSSYKIFENPKQKEAVEDPSVRWKDPDCWLYLSDEQRDVINQWYMDLLIEQEEAKQAAQGFWPVIIGLIPFAIFHVLKPDASLLEFLFEFLAALFIYSFVFFLFASAYRWARDTKPRTMSKFEPFWFHLVAVGFSILVSYFFLSVI